MLSRLKLVLSVLLLASCATAGSWQRLGKAGDWKNTIAAASIGDKLYTVESSGALYVTDTGTAQWTQLGKPEFGQTQFMVPIGKDLYTIERTGSLYRVNPANGSWVQVGPAGGWKGTLAATALNGKLYTAEVTGALYVSDVQAGTWQQLGKLDFAGTRFLFAIGPSLYSIERDGNFYSINPQDGSWAPVWRNKEWVNTIAVAPFKGKLFSVERSGALYVTDVIATKWEKLGEPDFGRTRQMVAAGESLFTIETDGSLYKVEAF